MMTKEEMRIAIAEKCGYERGTAWSAPHYWFLNGTANGAFAEDKLPDYLNDLNAMHEAEKIFLPVGMGKGKFDTALLKIVLRDRGTMTTEYSFHLTHATSTQRAEAFCRVFWPKKFKN